MAADVHACALRIREGRPASFTLRLATFTPGAWGPGPPGVSPGAWGRAFQGLGKANSVSAIYTEREPGEWVGDGPLAFLGCKGKRGGFFHPLNHPTRPPRADNDGNRNGQSHSDSISTCIDIGSKSISDNKITNHTARFFWVASVALSTCNDSVAHW